MKKNIKLGAVAAACMLCSSLSIAEPEALHISKSVDVNAPAAEVWKLVGNYNAIPTWHPAVTTSDLTGTGYAHGDIRVLTLKDGAKIYDELTVYEDLEKSYTYRLIKSPLPLFGYIGQLSVVDNKQGGSTVTWSSRFYADGVGDDEAMNIIDGVYASGLESLKVKYQ